MTVREINSSPEFHFVDMTLLLEALREAEESPQILVEGNSVVLQQELAVARSVYTIAKERQCFECLGYIANLKKMLVLETSLIERGVKLFITGGKSFSISALATYDMSIPWGILQLSCRLHYLSSHEKNRLDSPQYRTLIFDCCKALERFPSNAKDILNILDYLTHVEIQGNLSTLMAPVSAAFDYWRDFGSASRWGALAINHAREAEARFATLLQGFRKEVESASGGEIKSGLPELLRKKFHVIYSLFVGSIEKAVDLYRGENFRSAIQHYSNSYSLLKVVAQSQGSDINQYILRAIPPSSPLKAVPSFSNQDSFPPNILQALRAMDIRTLPTPEEFSQPMRPISFASIIDEYRKQYELQKIHPLPEPSTTSDFLPRPQRTSQQGRSVKSGRNPKPKPVVHKSPSSDEKAASKRESLPPAAPSAGCVSEVMPSERDAPHVLNEEQKCTQDTSSKDRDLPRISDPMVGLQPTSSQLRSAPKANIAVSMPAREVLRDHQRSTQVNDGPDLSACYADHAGRWANPERDIFQEDLTYRSQSLSENVKKEIRFRHAFGHALIPVIINEGKRFEKKGSHGGLLRVSYTLPGDIVSPDGIYEKVVFTVSVNPKTAVIIHVYATRKTPLQLIMEYAQDGCFPADDRELDETMVSHSRPARSSYSLPDDGSRVSSVSPECITVTQIDGYTLSVYPFPCV